MRSLQELRDVAEPAWPALEEAMAKAATPTEILPLDAATGEQALLRLQVTAGSALGALALHCGGVLVDHGWLRLLGGGSPPLGLVSANGLDEGPPSAPPPELLVGVDVLGGRYSINGGSLPGDLGEVLYFAPDTLGWEPLGMGHGAFVGWCLSDSFGTFNESLRWDAWEGEVAPLPFGMGLSVYPFPFTAEGRDLGAASRRPAPIVELLELWPSLAAQIGPADG